MSSGLTIDVTLKPRDSRVHTEIQIRKPFWFLEEDGKQLWKDGTECWRSSPQIWGGVVEGAVNLEVLRQLWGKDGCLQWISRWKQA